MSLQEESATAGRVCYCRKNLSLQEESVTAGRVCHCRTGITSCNDCVTGPAAEDTLNIEVFVLLHMQAGLPLQHSHHSMADCRATAVPLIPPLCTPSRVSCSFYPTQATRCHARFKDAEGAHLHACSLRAAVADLGQGVSRPSAGYTQRGRGGRFPAASCPPQWQ